MDRLAAMNAFVRVVETGSFSAAARQLRMGQPAVSKAIARIEDRLGTRLLLRTTRGLSPTDAGLSFYEGARRAVDEAEAAESAARGAAAALTGRLRIAMSVTFGRLHVVPHLAAFLAAHPQLEIEIGMDDSTADLIGEGMDVALRLGGSPDSVLTGRKIAECRRMVIATPAYLARVGEPLSPGDLARHEAILIEQPGYSNRWTFRKEPEEISVALKGRLRVTSGEGIREAVFAGIGLAVASEWMFAPELNSGRVRPVLTEWTLPSLQLWGLFPGGRKASAKARVFVDFLATRLGEGQVSS